MVNDIGSDQERILGFVFPPLLRTRLVFEAQELIIPPAVIGAMWRGAFGRALRTNDPAVYSRMFEPCLPESPIPAGNFPSPFVLDADSPSDLVVLSGDPIALDITLFGPAVNDAAAIVEAFQQAGIDGLGKGRGRADLQQAGTVWGDDPEGRPEIPTVPGAIAESW